MSRKTHAFELFSHGYGPNDPEIEALGLKYKTRHGYYIEWKNLTDSIEIPPDDDKSNQETPDNGSQGDSDNGAKKKKVPTSPKLTTSVDEASRLRFTPKIMECSFTPVMRAAQEAAIREWGWDPRMPLENFLDTVLHTFYRDRGIILAGYFKIEQSQEETAS